MGSAFAGALINARAGKRAGQVADELRARFPRGCVHLTGALDEIAPALDALRALDVGTIVLVGGDGTVSATLTELVRSWPQAEWPAIVLTCGGTVNTIAKALGARRSPEAAVDHLLAGDVPRETLRPALRVSADGQEPLCGMIFGNGVATRWLEAYYAAPSQGVVEAARLVSQAVGSALVGGSFARQLFEPFEGRLRVDGHWLDDQAFTAIGASTIRDVGLGFRPFHSAEQHPGRFHLLHTDAGPGRVVLELPAARLGLADAPGCGCLRHHSPQRAEITLDTPQRWMIDADIQAPAKELQLSITTPLRFWTF